MQRRAADPNVQARRVPLRTMRGLTSGDVALPKVTRLSGRCAHPRDAARQTLLGALQARRVPLRTMRGLALGDIALSK